MFRNNKSVSLALSLCSTNFKLVETNSHHNTTYQRVPMESIYHAKANLLRSILCSVCGPIIPGMVAVPLQVVVQATGVLTLHLSL